MYGSLAALITLLPYYSAPSGIIGLFLTIVGVLSATVFVKTGFEWPRALAALIIPLFFLIMGIRWFSAWAHELFGVLVISLILFFFSITLPIILPTISKHIYQEQMAPQSKIGRVLYKYSVQFIGAFGAIGALVGIYGRRAGFGEIIKLAIGVASILVGLFLAQAFSQQLIDETIV